MITIKDIAKLAGVSSSTVSKVLNNYTDISEETRRRVQKIIVEHHFSPNSSAQNLTLKKRKNIALVMSGLDEVDENDIIPIRELKGVLANATTYGYDIAFHPITSIMQKTKSYYAFCSENNIAGAVLAGIRTDDPYFQELANSDIPCVLIDIYAQGNHSSSISIDNVEASITAVQYLIDHNHKHIGIMNGKLQSVVGIERYAGYCQALINNKIELHKEYTFTADFDEECAYHAGIQLLSNHQEITAVFCASDVMAVGLYRAAKELHKRIPEDISVIGFDDIPIAKYISPSLTTIHQDFYNFGYRAVDLLSDLIQNPDKGGSHIFDAYELIKRQSVSTLKK